MNSEAEKTILLVEDEPLTAMLETQQLKKKGYSVHHVNNGEDAVKAIMDNEHPVDLILMDIDLGSGIDGTQAAEQILNHIDIPVVFLSSHTEPEVVEKTEKITSYGYVVKNSGIVVLDASIKMALKLFNAKVVNKQTEDDLIKSEKKYQMLFENMNVSFALHEAIYDDNGNPVDYRFLDMNPMFLNNLGCTAREIRGHTAKELFPNTEQYWIDTFGAVAKTGKSAAFENYSSELNLWFNTYIFSPQKNQFASFFIDITKQKQAEEALKAKNEELESTNEELTTALEEMEAANEELISTNQSIQQAEESLRKSEAIKNKMVSNIGDVIVIIDKNGINQYKSPNITKRFGWTPEELVGENTWNNIHPDDLEAGQSFFSTILTEPNASGTTEMRYKRKDGNYVWIEISVINLLQDKDVQGILGNYYDITERKQAEENLKESEASYRLIADNTSDSIWVMNADLRFTYLSPSTEKLFGYSVEEWETLDWNTFVDPDYIEAIFNVLNKLKSDKQGKLNPVSVPVRHKNGTQLWVEFSATALYDENNVFTGVVGVTRDITGRKNTDQALKESEKKLSLIVNESPFPVAMSDLNNEKIQYWSFNAKKKFGHSPATISEWYVLAYPDPEYRKQTIERWKPFLENAWESDTAINTGEYHITCKDGSIKICEIYAQYIKHIQHSIVVTFNDITERKKAEEEIQKQLTEKETLLREVHHRVKNNIANIENFLLLQHDSTDNPEAKSVIKDAVSRVQSMRILYDKLLISKDLREISIKNYIEDLIDSLHNVFDEKDNIIIERHISEFSIIPKQAITIGIIMNELLTNVFKYAFEDRDKGTVYVSIEKNENMVTIIIKDNGIGIDERIMENKSPGFGLTIVKMLVEQLNGTCNIVNENGTRSVIEFEL